MEVNKLDMVYRNDKYRNTTWYLILDGTEYMDIIGLLSGHRCWEMIRFTCWIGLRRHDRIYKNDRNQGIYEWLHEMHDVNVLCAFACYVWSYGERFIHWAVSSPHEYISFYRMQVALHNTELGLAGWYSGSLILHEVNCIRVCVYQL